MYIGIQFEQIKGEVEILNVGITDEILKSLSLAISYQMKEIDMLKHKDQFCFNGKSSLMLTLRTRRTNKSTMLE